MARHAHAIAAAELEVVRSRRELREGVRRLGRTLSRPSFLAAAAALGAILGSSLTRRGRAGAVAGLLASALLRRGVEHLIAAARRGSTPAYRPFPGPAR